MKLKIIPHLDTVSDDARLLGAVNTVIPSTDPSTGERKLHGENTDWQAIHEAAQTNLDPSILSLSSSNTSLDVLVIGAGGTCRAAIYAMHTLGATSIYLFNRTLSHAQKVKDSFPAEYNIVVVDSLDLQIKPSVIVSTVPGESLTLEKLSSEGIHLPESALSASHGVAIDLAYKPMKTALITAAGNKAGWKAVPGIEILCLQGFVQYRLWTGKVAPKDKIRRAVMEQYHA